MFWTHVMARVACWWYWSLDMATCAWKHEHRHLQYRSFTWSWTKNFGHKRYECAQPVQLILNPNLHLQIIMHHVPWSYSHTCILQELKFPAPTSRTNPDVSVLSCHTLVRFVFFCTIPVSESHKKFSFSLIQGTELFIYTRTCVLHTRKWIVHRRKWFIHTW